MGKEKYRAVYVRVKVDDKFLKMGDAYVHVPAKHNMFPFNNRKCNGSIVISGLHNFRCLKCGEEVGIADKDTIKALEVIRISKNTLLA